VRLPSIAVAAAALAVVAASATSHAAQAADPVDRVYITFGSAVRLPDTTLAPGTYIFMAGQPVAGQLVIDIFNSDASRQITTVLAIESTLGRPSTGTLLDYPGTRPPALRAWFHPGNVRGYEFVYPRDEAAAIFRTSSVPVASTIRDDAAASVVGLLPIVHADDAYRAGIEPDVSTALGVSSMPPGPVDRLALARVAILGHVDSVPKDIATRLKLLDSQIRDVHTAYRTDAADLPHRLKLARASLDNMPSLPDRNAGTFVQTPAVRHVLERVRAQVEAFERFLR